MNDAITDNDVLFMKTQVWKGETFDELRATYASIYAADGTYGHADAISALMGQANDAADLMIDLLVGQAMLIDRYFCDCLLPVASHLDDWRENARGVQLLLDDLLLSCEVLGCVVNGPGFVTSGQLQARDGNYVCEAEVPQRLLAYKTIANMVFACDEGVRATLRTVVQAVCSNLELLLEADDAPDLYLSLCYSVGGFVACGADYWCEPLLIVAEAARTTGHEALVCGAIDEVIGHLTSVETRHDEVRRDVEGCLTKLRDGLCCSGLVGDDQEEPVCPF